MAVKQKSIPSCRECLTRKDSCFSILSQEDVEVLEGSKEPTFYPKGQAIFFTGRYPTGVFCLMEGKVKMAKRGDDGKDQIVRFVLPGKLLGIRAFLSESPYTATAVALEDSWICYIPRDTFIDLTSKYPSITSCMVTTLSQLLCEAEDKMTSIAQKNVRERLAETLLELLIVFSYGEDGKEELNPISLSREDLANIVGTATETVIRLISEFRESKLIEVKGRRIYLKDVQTLKRISKGYYH